VGTFPGGSAQPVGAREGPVGWCPDQGNAVTSDSALRERRSGAHAGLEIRPLWSSPRVSGRAWFDVIAFGLPH
jgi:hypothetical protein